MTRSSGDGETITSELDEADERLLREIAAAPPRRPPSTVENGTRWGGDGRYVIEAKVGRGGMGTVYAALDTLLTRRVALKMLDAPDVEQDVVARRRLLREARLAASLEHDRIARVYDVGTHDGVDFVAMELVRGVTLRQRAKDGPLSGDEILTIVTQIAEALRVLHASGVIHRDLKPDNVMLTEGSGAKVLDFGLARALLLPEASVPIASSTLGGGGSSLATSGTPGYMAPEQWLGEPLDARVDVFALGVIVYELVTGARPFASDSPAGVRRATCAHTPSFEGARWPSGLVDLTRRMLAKAPRDRPADGDAVLRMLHALRPQAAPPRDPAAIQRARRRAFVAIAIGLALALATVVAIGVGRRIARDRAHARALAAPPPRDMALVRGGTMTIGASQADVDAACTELGSQCDRQRLSWSMPARSVTVAPFYLDVHEVTNTEMVDMLNGLRGAVLVVEDEDSHLPRYVRFNAGLAQEAQVLVDLYDSTTGIEYVPTMGEYAQMYRVRPGRERWPVTQVTLFGARRFCASRGKRLPTDEEWEAAAGGVEDRKYPWGAAPVRCGGVRVAPDGGVESEPGCPATPLPTDVGSSLQDVTPDGIFDLGGNVGEWTDTVFGAEGNLPIGDVDIRPYATRGGSFARALGARTTLRTQQPPLAAGINGGFRCALSLALP